MTLAVRRRENSPQQVGRWGPLSELEELQDRTVQLLENAWSGTGLAGAQRIEVQAASSESA